VDFKAVHLKVSARTETRHAGTDNQYFLFHPVSGFGIKIRMERLTANDGGLSVV
jgi:hypothetical protein